MPVKRSVVPVVLQSALWIVVLGALSSSLLNPSPVGAATFQVNATSDIDPPDDCEPSPGDCSLREALIAANSAGGQHTILLAAGQTYTLSIAGADEDGAETGDLDVAGGVDITIEVAGGGTATIDAAGLGDRVIQVLTDGRLTLDGITVTGGDRSGSVGGGIYVDANATGTLTDSTVRANAAQTGGGIFNLGEVTLTRSAVSENTGSLGAGIRSTGVLTVIESAVTFNSRANGGGISSSGILTLTNSSVSHNTGFSGAGLMLEGPATITGSTINGNTAEETGRGGGIYSTTGSVVTLTSSTVSGNTATGSGFGSGGGIYNEGGTVTVTNSTISGNRATRQCLFCGGGGIFTGAGVTLTNSTVSGNTAYQGGGIFGADLVSTNSTVSGNSAGTAGGIFIPLGSLTLTNTIVADQAQGEDCRLDAIEPLTSGGTIVSGGNNLDSDGTCLPADIVQTGDVPDGTANLGPLTPGSTATHALLPGSQAIDAGNNAVCAAAPVNGLDQRGVERPQDGNGDGVAVCDIGAYEVARPDLTVTKLCVGTGFEATFAVTVAGLGAPIACGASVTFADLQPGTHTVGETIAGPDASEFAPAIACDGEIAAAGASIELTVPEGIEADVSCVVVNFFDPVATSDDALDEVLALIVMLPVGIEIDVDNGNTNVAGIDNENANDNVNSNTNANDNVNPNHNENANTSDNVQDHDNAQDQDNANDQTNDVTSSPEVNIDFGR